MFNGEFLINDDEEVCEYLEWLIENLQAWKTEDTSEQNQLVEKFQNKGGLIKLLEIENITIWVISLAK